VGQPFLAAAGFWSFYMGLVLVPMRRPHRWQLAAMWGRRFRLPTPDVLLQKTSPLPSDLTEATVCLSPGVWPAPSWVRPAQRRRQRAAACGASKPSSGTTSIKISKSPRNAPPATPSPTIPNTFERVQRIANACEPSYHRAFKELPRLQEVARAHGLRSEDPEPEPAAAMPEAA